MTLAIYFGKRYLISFIRVFLSIVLLVLLFDFLTNLSRLNGIEAQISTENILRNADRPDAREIINSFDLLKLTLNANVDSMIINGIAKDR